MQNDAISADPEYDWSAEKNAWLIAHRGLRFEDVVRAIANGKLLGVFAQSENSRHPHQRVFVVDIRGYAHLIPYVKTPSGYFLKTIIPSRRQTRKFLKN